MRIGCLQFAPQVGDVDNNLNRADCVLSRSNLQTLDLLVLPEMAFTAGITSPWARTTALKHNCIVTAGYPEKVNVSNKWPANPKYYSSVIMVNSEGETVANYRKSFLYNTDETWALEGEGGFYNGDNEKLGNLAMGIGKRNEIVARTAVLTGILGLDLKSAWEFAHHILHAQANLVILTLAAEAVVEIIVVFANRCGTEEEVTYAGTSAVIGINNGEVKVYGILGRGEKGLLVVDTNRRPEAKLVSTPNSAGTEPPETVPSSKTTEDQPLILSDWADNDSGNGSEDVDTYYYEFSPVSPSDSRGPPFFFHPKPTPISELYYDLPSPDCERTNCKISSPGSGVLYRPSTPKSRVLSRNENRELIDPKGISEELDEVDESYVERYGRNSASAVPDGLQATFSADPLGPRSEYYLPRSRSTVW
ncbi:related to amino-terminal amidase [Rhynchosporium graminicola]|uniref:Related to amino-terminal amidase n=1 Tax=Rhynchosporium graminicola TaxID=2792576 RepID=A0A1E1LAV4_9HELO|nr:related to amino-terminal amidase [Rhynchosporium commune]